MRKFYLLTFILTCISFSVFAQSEANIWYFGINAGLDFNTFPVASLSNGQINSHGGSSVMCDSNGDLLFYSDGQNVYNKNHNQMPNGFGLLGNSSSTQNSIILPQPGSSSIYYLFTNGGYNDQYGLKYSVVDMSLNGGLGDVTATKNVSLKDSTTEKLTATYHANETDIWIITHERTTNGFYAYLLSSTGLGNAVVSNVGIAHQGSVSDSHVWIGQMKASPDGTRLAVATSANSNTIEIFDFDNSTGVITSPITINGAQYEYPYGIEFSPDGTLLYASTNRNNKLYQFNLQAGSATDIINSSTLIGESASNNLGALQIGPDSKIYVARYLSYDLAIINNPNLIGTNCDFVDYGVNLGTKRSRRGLPNFITSYFNNPRVLFYNTCFGDSTQFYISDLNGVLSVEWNFGDPSSGAGNTSTDNFPIHIFTAPGSYDVTLTRYFSGFSDNVTQTVVIQPLPNVDIGPQYMYLCVGEDTTLFAGPGFVTYEWQNGSSTSTFLVTSPGTYSVTVTDDFGCINSDEVDISSIEAPDIELGPDTFLCDGQNLPLSALYGESSYVWSTGETSFSIVVDQAGVYSVTVSNDCGELIDTINVDFYPELSFDLGDNKEICPGDTISFDPGNLNVSYQWSDGSTGQTIDVWSGGVYTLTAYYPGIACPEAIDSVSVIQLDNPIIYTGNDTTVCEGEMVPLYSSGQFVTDYLWSNGDTDQNIIVNQAGLYTIVGSNICSSDTDSVFVFITPLPSVDAGPDTAMYDDESVQLTATFNSNWIYTWTPDTYLDQSDIHNPVASPTESIIYTVEVIDTMGCRQTTTVTIDISERPLPEIEIFNTFSPNADGINDFWVIKNIDRYELNRLEIYNRNGNLIFSTDHYQNEWDGTYNENPVPAHTYYYILDLGVDEATGGRYRTGNVTVIR